MKRVILFVMAMLFFAPVGDLLAQEQKTKSGKRKVEKKDPREEASPFRSYLQYRVAGPYSQMASMPLFQRQRDILSELDKLKSQEVVLKHRLGSIHPSYVLVKQEIAVLEKRLAKVSNSLGTVYGSKPNKTNVFQAVKQLEELSVVFKPENSAERELKDALTKLFKVRNKYNVQLANGKIGLAPKSIEKKKKQTQYRKLPSDLKSTVYQEFRKDKLLKRNQDIVNSRQQLADLFQTLEERKKKLEDKSALVLLFEGNQSKDAKKKLAEIEQQKKDLQDAYKNIRVYQATLLNRLNDLDQMNSVLHDQVDLFYQRSKRNGEKTRVPPSDQKRKKTSNSVDQRLDRVEKRLGDMAVLLKKLLKEKE